MNTKSAANTSNPRGIYTVGLLAIILAILFWRSFLPDFVHFSNDGPLGQQNAAWSRMPDSLTGMWGELSYLGGNGGAATLNITALLHLLLSPVAFAKFYPVLTLLLLGVGAWAFFRQLKLTPLAAGLGAIAAMLNSTFFSNACWGVGSGEIAIGMDFLALALVVSNTRETPWLISWVRLALAGFCVGMNVMEAADIGALLSMLVALFVFFRSLAEEGGLVANGIRGAARVAVIAIFAGLIALQTVLSLVGTEIQGVAGNAQDTETKAQHWDWATQWSLPKAETLNLIIPGLFGYKMDTPKDMMPALTNAYQSGVYWGGVGRDPAIDRYFDAGGKEPPSAGFMRFTGGGNYCGILVVLVVGWAVAQVFRRENSPFPTAQKRLIQFWVAVALISLPLAWGRFAPFSRSADGFLFYALLYKLPYFSTIRNPAKFLIFLSFALVIIFAYGVHALNRRYLDGTAMKTLDFTAQVKNWWARVSNFDRKWTYVTVGIICAGLVGTLIYTAEKPAMISYLQKVGFGDTDASHANSAPALFEFSLGQLEWFLALLAMATGLLLAVIAGYFNGPRAAMGSVLLGGFLIFDMGRANLPWVVHWDYKQKYEVGSLNPIVKLLSEKPYEHRVAGLPFQVPPGLELFDQLYRIEWMQHHFPYYNIQSHDVVQLPRLPQDMKAFKEALAPHGDAGTAPLIAREWQLTNTRYLLGPAGYLEVMNAQLDPLMHRFRIVQRFDVVPKPGIERPTRLEELTAVPDENGNYALFEFTGALPRAKVFSNWQVNTNDSVNLHTLADLNFDPARTVLISTPEKDLPPTAANTDTGSVEYKNYASKHIVLLANATSPSVLLLNDNYDPHWRVTVDGKPAGLLRCNFIMRGVYLPTAGQHTVDFQFSLPNWQFYTTLVAILFGIVLAVFLVIRAGSQSAEPGKTR